LPDCKNPADLRFALQKFGIKIDYKHKRTTNHIEGVSFRYNNIAFKGSQIDRKFSFGNLKKAFEENIKIRQEQTAKAEEQQEKQLPKVQPQMESKPKISTIGGVELTTEQWQTLKGDSYPCNMEGKKCENKFTCGRVIVTGKNGLDVFIYFVLTDKAAENFDKYLFDFKKILWFKD
jgi:hypothetical protein